MATSNRALGLLYQRVADGIVKGIESGKWHPGDRLPSERALCELFSVSQITVRRALRELALAGRVYSHHGLGWFVNPDPPPDEPVAEVVLVVSQMDWLLAQVYGLLVEALRPSRIAARLALTGGDRGLEDEALALAARHDACAALVVVAGRDEGMDARYEAMQQGSDLPVVLLLREVEGVSLPSVALDEVQAMATITRHLLQMGHRRLAYLGDDPTLIEGKRRYWGFASTLWEEGLELPMDWAFSGSLTGDPAARFHGVFQGREAPSALVCTSDLRAAEAILQLTSMGLRCPEDVAVVGLGNRDFSAFLTPPLTTYRFDLVGLVGAITAAVTAIHEGREPASARFAGRIVMRQSCGSALWRVPSHTTATRTPSRGAASSSVEASTPAERDSQQRRLL